MNILRIEHDPATRTIRLTGELDHSSAPDLTAILGLSAGATPDLHLDLHLDLRGLTFMDSTGLHLIVDATRALTGGAALVLIGPRPPVVRVLELSAIVDHIPNLRVVAAPDQQAPSPAVPEPPLV